MVAKWVISSLEAPFLKVGSYLLSIGRPSPQICRGFCFVHIFMLQPLPLLLRSTSPRNPKASPKLLLSSFTLSGLSFNLKHIVTMTTTNNNETQPLLVVENFIDGQFLTTENYLDSFEPATGKVWAKIPDSGLEEVEQAVKAAKKAFR